MTLRAGVWLTVLAAACGGDRAAPPTASPPTVPAPTVPAPGPTPADSTSFRVAVLLGGSPAPTAEDVRRIFAGADDILFRKTGSHMAEVDLLTVGPGSPLTQATSHVNARASAPPDGVLVFSDDATAVNAGGYSQTFNLPPPNQNRFPSPSVGANQAYLAVVHFFHMYARCGYDGSSWLTSNRIGTASSGGECRGQSGLVCVNNGRYWMCPDSVNDLYSDIDYFTACTVVHEFMHPFGSAGAQDHYGTPTCLARTGMSQADAQNRIVAQQSCGMCPDVYQSFPRR